MLKKIFSVVILVAVIFSVYSIIMGITKFHRDAKNMANNVALLESNMKIIAGNVISLQKSREIEANNLTGILSDFGIRMSALENNNTQKNTRRLLQEITKARKDLYEYGLIVAQSGCKPRAEEDKSDITTTDRFELPEEDE